MTEDELTLKVMQMLQADHGLLIVGVPLVAWALVVLQHLFDTLVDAMGAALSDQGLGLGHRRGCLRDRFEVFLVLLRAPMGWRLALVEALGLAGCDRVSGHWLAP